MSSEATLSRDLAAVGRASRARPIAVEQTLRAVGALPAATVVSAVAASRALAKNDLVLVSAAQIYASRVARIAAGLVATLFFGARIVDVLIPVPVLRDEHRFLVLWKYMTDLRVFAGIALVYVLADGVAIRRFGRHVAGATNPRERARMLVHSVERWSLVVGIGALSMIVVIQITERIGYRGQSLLWIQSNGTPEWTQSNAITAASPLLIAIAVAWLAAAWVGRVRRWRIASWIGATCTVAAVIILAATGAVDDKSLIASSFAQGSALLAAVLAIASFAVVLRSRENQTLSSLGADEEQVVIAGARDVTSMPSIYAARVARMVAGIYSLLVMSAFIVVVFAYQRPAEVWESTFSHTLLDRQSYDLVLPFVATVMIVYVAAWVLARRVCERELHDDGAPLERGREMIRTIGRASYETTIAAGLSFLLVFVLIRGMAGSEERLVWLVIPHDEWVPAWWNDFQQVVRVALVGSLVVGLGAGIASARWRWLPGESLTIVAAIFVSLGTYGFLVSDGRLDTWIDEMGGLDVNVSMIVIAILFTFFSIVGAAAAIARLDRRERESVGL